MISFDYIDHFFDLIIESREKIEKMEIKRVTFGVHTKNSLVLHININNEDYTMVTYRLYSQCWKLRCSTQHHGKKSKCYSKAMISVPEFFDSLTTTTVHGIKRYKEVMVLENRSDKRLINKDNYKLLKCSLHTCIKKHTYYDTHLYFRNNARLSALSNPQLGMSHY